MDEHTDNFIIDIKNLTKIYRSKRGKVRALDNITLNIERGDIFGFIGPNGAGKTTTIQIMTGIIPPTSGEVIIAGFDITKNPIEVKKKIGAMPEEIGFYNNMTGKDILEYHAGFYDGGKYKKNIYSTAEKTGIDGYLDKKVKEYSLGMKKRLAVTQALINEPELLILDEPTLALDPKGIHFFTDLIKDLNHEGITIFLSSHILPVVQNLCNKVGIINKGKILRTDHIGKLSEELLEKEKTTNVFFEVKNFNRSVLEDIKNLDDVLDINISNKGLRIKIDNNDKIINDINSFLIKKNVTIRSISIENPDLEKVFLKFIDGDNDG